MIWLMYDFKSLVDGAKMDVPSNWQFFFNRKFPETNEQVSDVTSKDEICTKHQWAQSLMGRNNGEAKNCTHTHVHTRQFSPTASPKSGAGGNEEEKS